MLISKKPHLIQNENEKRRRNTWKRQVIKPNYMFNPVNTRILGGTTSPLMISITHSPNSGPVINFNTTTKSVLTHTTPDDSTLPTKTRHDANNVPNEFSYGNKMNGTEIFVICIILLLWVLSLWKLIRNFDKLSTTQYRQIPYKYKLKDPQNIGKVKIVNNSNDAVLYTRDPLKQLKARSIDDLTTSITLKIDPIKLKNKRATLHNFLFNNRKDSTASTSRQDESLEDEYRRVGENYSLNNANLDKYQIYVRQNSQNSSGCPGGLRKNLSLTSLCEVNEREMRRKASSTKRHSLKEHDVHLITINQYNNSDNNQNRGQIYKQSSLLDPNLLSPLVRRSLLDLHQKSVENVRTRLSSENSSIKKDESVGPSITQTPSSPNNIEYDCANDNNNSKNKKIKDTDVNILTKKEKKKFKLYFLGLKNNNSNNINEEFFGSAV